MRGTSRPVARAELAGLPVYEPGRAAPPGAIKLASNENSYGPSRSVQRALKSFRSLERYPDGGSDRLRRALSRALGVRPEGILIGAGSDEIGDFLARAYLRPADCVVLPRYTFIRYAMAARMSGSRRLETKVHGDFSVDVGDLARAIRSARPRMVCLANPNNPTGAHIGRGELEALLKATPDRTLFVLDEAYFEYARGTPGYPDSLRLLPSHPNLVILRTFSKIYGLASLRVGYALAHPDVVRELHKVRPPFNVNSAGQAAAEAALADQAHVRRCARLNAKERDRLSRRLAEMGFRVYPSRGNFLLVGLRTGDGSSAFKALARRGVIVRPLLPYGLPRHLRVTVGTPSENARLLKAMSALA